MGRRCLALCAEQHAARLRFGERQRSLPDRFAVEHRRQPDCLERRAAFGSDPAAGVRCPFVGAADDARSFTGDPHRRARCVVRCGQRRFQSERWHRRRSARDGSPAGWHAFHGAKLPRIPHLPRTNRAALELLQPADPRRPAARRTRAKRRLAQCRSQRRRLCRLQRRGFPPVGISAYINANGTVQNRGRLR